MSNSIYSELSKDWIEKLLKLYPEYTKVYGIFQGKDKRLRVVLQNPKPTPIPCKTISYPKALMEVHLGRRLKTKEDGVDEEETVDHIDRDFLNNDISNLRVVKKREHSIYDVLRVEYPLVNCVSCGNEFRVTPSQVSTLSLTIKNGPFCSKKCSGKYGKYVQETNIRSPGKKIRLNYYQLSKNFQLNDHFSETKRDTLCSRCGKAIQTNIVNTNVYCSLDCIGIANTRGTKKTKSPKIFFHEVSYEELIMYLSGLLPE